VAARHPVVAARPASAAACARVVVGLAAAVGALLLAACGGGTSPPAPTEPPPVAAAVLTPAAPGELTAYLRERLRQRLGSGSPLASGAVGSPPAGFATAADPAAPATRVQEPGVDEDDRIKAHGSDVYTLHERTLRHDRLAGPQTLLHQQSLVLDPEPGDAETRFDGLYLTDDGAQAVVVGRSWAVVDWRGDCGAEVCPALGLIDVVPTLPRVLVQPLRTQPALAAGGRIVIDGRWVGSRRLGDRLVVVTTHAPALAVDALPPSATPAEREAALAALQAADLLPQLRVGAAPATPLVDESACYLQPGNASAAVEITTITVFDLASPTLAHRSRCFVGGSEALYLAADGLYLATTRTASAGTGVGAVFPADMRTDIHRFSLAGERPDYRASGSVDGHLGWDEERRPYRFSAWNGDLRVLSFTGSVGWAVPADAGVTAPSPATLTVLREDGDRLRELARLPNASRPAPLGKPGEQVYAVRFVQDRGYVVTFRQVDPLYVLDLADPADPRAAGVLELPGFAQDLLPLGDGWLLGIGRDAGPDGVVTGLQVTLFDVRDPAQPLLRERRTLGGAGSSSALDASRHGVNLAWRDSIARVALPVALALDDGWRQGLQRIEVDPAVGTLRLEPLIERTPALPWPDPSADRSLQIGDDLVWLSQDLVGAWAW
jgi:hypothetical protein